MRGAARQTPKRPGPRTANAVGGVGASRVPLAAGRHRRLILRLRADLRPGTWVQAAKELRDHLVLPEVDDKALAGLKFSDALPRHLAAATLAARLADLDHAADLLTQPVRFERSYLGLAPEHAADKKLALKATLCVDLIHRSVVTR
jgi:hypothetical protein